MTLTDKLKSFTVPALRRDVSKLENVLWLGRNLAANNANNPLLGEVLADLRNLRRELLKLP